MNKDKIQVLYQLKIDKSIFVKQLEVSVLPQLGTNDTFIMDVAGQLFVPKGIEEVRHWDKESSSTYEYRVIWGLKDTSYFTKKPGLVEDFFLLAVMKEGYTLGNE